MNFYNENDPKAAAWLKQLIVDGLIPKGHVDERSIAEVRPADLDGFSQCHFFAGIGGWSYALKLAGWPEDKPVWTGSCPCQPFSCAGKRKGEADERHVWPDFRRLISERTPPTIFGEQVSSAAGRLWLSRVRTDLEILEYAVGAEDLCAAGVSAPHARGRLYWVANSTGEQALSATENRFHTEPSSDSSNAGNSTGLVNADGYHGHWWSGPLQVGRNCIEGEVARGGRKYRAQWRIKPGLSLLADGIPGRVAQLCGFGNAIVPQVAAEFIKAFFEIQLTKSATLTPDSMHK